MNYLSLIVLLTINISLYPAHMGASGKQDKQSPKLASSDTTEQLNEFKSLTKTLSLEEKTLLAAVVEKLIQKESIEQETKRAIQCENYEDLGDAIMIITTINSRINNNDFQPLLDLYEFLRPGHSKQLKDNLNATDEKLKKENYPAHFIRHFAHLDAYEILGVKKEGLTPQKVDEAFKKLSKQLHPDKNLADPQSAREAFDLVSQAREKLLEKLKISSAKQSQK